MQTTNDIHFFFILPFDIGEKAIALYRAEFLKQSFVPSAVITNNISDYTAFEGVVREIHYKRLEIFLKKYSFIDDVLEFKAVPFENQKPYPFLINTFIKEHSEFTIKKMAYER